MANFISDFFENRGWLGLVQQNPATGALEVGGVEIPAALPYLWADFTALDWTQLDGVIFRVTDKHSVGTTGGSYWVGDAVGDRPVLISGPLEFTTLAAAPSPVTYPGLRILPGNVGVVCKSDGARYRIENWIATLKNTLTSTPHPGPFSTESILQSVVFPADVNNNSIVADGDMIQVYKAWGHKTGTTDSMTRRYLLGVSTTVGDYTGSSSGEVLTTTDTAALATIARADKLFDIMRLTSTTVTIDGVTTATATFSGGGAFSTAHNSTTVTTTSFDSATPPSLHYAIKLSGTTDTNLALRQGYQVRIMRGY